MERTWACPKPESWPVSCPGPQSPSQGPTPSRGSPLLCGNSYAPPVSGAEPRSARVGAMLGRPVNAAVARFFLFFAWFFLSFFKGFSVFFWFFVSFSFFFLKNCKYFQNLNILKTFEHFLLLNNFQI
jgi:hypothetical protein